MNQDSLLEIVNEVDETAPSRITFVSYNIRYAVGAFLISGSYLRRLGVSLPHRRGTLIDRHLKRAARAFRLNDKRLPAPHLIALQEADKDTVRSGKRHIARELAHRLKMNYAHAATDLPRTEPEQKKLWWLDFEEHIEPTDAGDTGVAVLSKLKLETVERLELPCAVCRWRPRTAIRAGVTLNNRKLHLYSAHIDTHATTHDQLAQHATIINHIKHHVPPDEAVIFAGDFNTLSRAGGVEVRAYLESHGLTTPFATGTTTWRAGVIKLHTDWIFSRGLKVTDYGVRKWLGVSDHYPLWVTFEI